MTRTVSSGRRSGNYKPSIWDFDFIQSLSSEYKEDMYSKRASELAVEVGMMLDEEADEGVRLLEFIDDLERLCISYRFRDKINQILIRVYEELGHKHSDRDLYSTALEFRLLRQHGFPVSQDVFDCFKNDKGNFKKSLVGDTKGLLQLYEASFLLTQGENTLEQAKEFAAKFLLQKKKTLNEGDDMDEYLSLLVSNALELPLHWRVPRPNARWFINAYERRPCDMNPIALELAKLDYNIAQATQQHELKFLSRWWKETRLAEKLPFARDRLLECYLWTIGCIFEPAHGYSRITLTKVAAFVTVIDDIFDVYGTLDELQLFNDVVQRWDIEALDKLPHYMQLCFLALNNFVDETAYHVLKEQGFNVIPHLRKSWAEMCRVFLQEAEWYSKGYTPNFEDYISNAWISSTVPVSVIHAFFLATNPIENEVALRLLNEHHDLARCPGMILRLANDLTTSQEEMRRGDVPKAIECYMKETGARIHEAQEHVRYMIYETWKEMNGAVTADSGFQQEFVRIAVDIGRMAQYMYQYGDGHGSQLPQMKDCILGAESYPRCGGLGVTMVSEPPIIEEGNSTWSCIWSELATQEDMRRGDVPKEIECYMNKTGSDILEAQEHVRFMIYETWKDMNGAVTADSVFHQEFDRIAIDIGRMA